MSEDDLKVFDSLDAAKKIDKQKTINVATSAGYSGSNNEYKNVAGDVIKINDDGSWQSGDANGRNFQLLNVFLKLGKDKFTSN